MQTIDLGDELKIKVKYKGAEYELREPTVKELEAFKNLDANSSDSIGTFLTGLGLPEGFYQDIGASKALQLVESVFEILTKKK